MPTSTRRTCPPQAELMPFFFVDCPRGRFPHRHDFSEAQRKNHINARASNKRSVLVKAKIAGGHNGSHTNEWKLARGLPSTDVDRAAFTSD
jgi:hypothetical protein